MEKVTDIIKHNIRQYAMLIALMIIMVAFQMLTKGVLLQPINVFRVILQNSYVLILAVGMILCILTGGNVDLSVGSILAFVSAVSAYFSVTLQIPVVLSIFFALLIGLLAGMWNGFWIAYIGVPSFIATLSGMLIFRGINNLILDGQTVQLPQLYGTIALGVIPDYFGSGDGLHVTTVIIGVICSIAYMLWEVVNRKVKMEQGFDVNPNEIFIFKLIIIASLINLFSVWLALANGLPYVVILLVFLIVFYSFITNKTVAGRHIYALGGNAKAAELSGINTKKVLFWVYANMGLLAAVAGIIFAGRLSSSSPTAGDGLELDAIAACFIGGASATGGVGTVIGTIIGGFIMGIMKNGMSISGISTFVQSIIQGVVLLLAVAFDVHTKSKQR